MKTTSGAGAEEDIFHSHIMENIFQIIMQFYWEIFWYQQVKEQLKLSKQDWKLNKTGN